jgi:hypothetical protein
MNDIRPHDNFVNDSGNFVYTKNECRTVSKKSRGEKKLLNLYSKEINLVLVLVECVVANE